MARLSTHVLDTARGKPAENLVLELYALRNGGWIHLTTATTNGDGRPEMPLLSGDRIEPGVYELRFHAGAYFRGLRFETTEPPFLDEVIVRFGVADATGHYHVPLLLAPYSYSTYRGS